MKGGGKKATQSVTILLHGDQNINLNFNFVGRFVVNIKNPNTADNVSSGSGFFVPAVFQLPGSTKLRVLHSISDVYNHSFDTGGFEIFGQL